VEAPEVGAVGVVAAAAAEEEAGPEVGAEAFLAD
jgi:hypothetical protein